MSSIDERTVKMRFENETFKAKAQETKGALADVNKAVEQTGRSGKGLLDLNKNMEAVQVTASKMSIVTAAALGTVTNAVVNAGAAAASALTMDPIRQGFSEYESLLTKQNVIMNATGKGAGVVKGYLNELNAYSDKTIYSFGDMTDSITKFVNAGVDMPTAVTSIMGIANSAAFAGASTQEASRAMYAFSQSMQTGYVMLNDWMQIENANMGTMAFKEELLKAGAAVGTLTKKGDGYVTASGKYVSAGKGWREGLQEQWATTEVLNSALGKYADTQTALGKKAFKSAQDVRTFTAFMDTLKESVGSGWATIFTALIGNLEQSTALWTGLSNTVGKGVHSFFQFGAEALTTWRKMGGFEKTLEGFSNILAPIGALFKLVGVAFRAAFPSGSKGAGATLYGISAAFAAITTPLQWLADLLTGATPVVQLFFSIIGLGITVLRRGVGFVFDFVKALLGLVDMPTPTSGGILGFIKDIGEAISKAVKQVQRLLDKGASLTDAFSSVKIKLPDMPNMPKMPSLPNMPAVSMPDFGSGIGGDMVAKFTSAKDAIMGMNVEADKTKYTAAFSGDTSGIDTVKGRFENLMRGFEGINGIIDKAWGYAKQFFGWLGDHLSGDDLVAAFNMSVLTTIGLAIARFFNSLNGGFMNMQGLVMSIAQIGPQINNTLSKLGDSFGAFQTAARAKLIIAIAIAIGVLAIALIALSFVPADRLGKALGAMAGLGLILSLTLRHIGKTVDAMTQAGTTGKLMSLSVAMLALGGAMLLLAGAMLIMDHVDVDGVAKGIITMFTVMKLTQSMGTMGKTAAKNMLAGAASILIVAWAMTALALALLLFKLVDWESMGKAGAALAGVGLAVGLLAKMPAAAMAKVGGAMLGVSFGMEALSRALVIFGFVKWESIAKAGVVLAGLTAALALLAWLGNPVTISGVVGLAIAMIMLAGAMIIMNDVEWASIGKLGLVLLVLIAAFALLLGVLAIAAPLIPILGLFALALLALGAGLFLFAGALAIAMALAAGGTAAFAALATGAAVAVAVFMQTLATEAPLIKDAFLKILQELIDAIVEAVPMVIDGVRRLWEAVKKEFTDGSDKAGAKKGGEKAVANVSDGIKKKMPSIVEKAKELIGKFIDGLISKADDIADKGVQLVVALAKGVSRNMDSIIAVGTEIIVKFIEGVGKAADKITKAAADTIIQFINDLSDTIRTRGPELRGAMLNLGVAMIQGLMGGIDQMFDIAMNKIGGLAEGMIGKAKSILKIWSPSRVFMSIGKFLVQGLTNGIQDNAVAAITAVASMVGGQIAVADSYISSFIQKLDQKSIAAAAKAQGLAAAAEKAANAAEKTEKNKKDDKSARALDEKARRAERKAAAAAAKSEAAVAASERAEEFEKADLITKAEMKSEDAQAQIDAAKAAERSAAAKLIEADALDRQAKAKGVNEKDAKAFKKQADDLRKAASQQAIQANNMLAAAQTSAAQALAYQQQAGAEAAASFQEQYEAAARADAEEEAFQKLTDKEKAVKKREEAARLQAKADAELAQAKVLAYSDLDAANELAQQALQTAEAARAALEEAENYTASSTSVGTGSTLNLDPSDAAAMAFNQYKDLYDAAYAAAAAGQSVEFNQYNTSPESLSTPEIYRQSNNLVAFAAQKLAGVS